jgi:hypothetical protein
VWCPGVGISRVGESAEDWRRGVGVGGGGKLVTGPAWPGCLAGLKLGLLSTSLPRRCMKTKWEQVDSALLLHPVCGCVCVSVRPVCVWRGPRWHTHTHSRAHAHPHTPTRHTVKHTSPPAPPSPIPPGWGRHIFLPFILRERERERDWCIGAVENACCTVRPTECSKAVKHCVMFVLTRTDRSIPAFNHKGTVWYIL